MLAFPRPQRLPISLVPQELARFAQGFDASVSEKVHDTGKRKRGFAQAQLLAIFQFTSSPKCLCHR
jgi:hypothetical protein